MTRASRFAFLLLLAGTSAAASDDWAQDVWLLERGTRETWRPAIRRLVTSERIQPLALGSVLRRMEVLDTRDRFDLCNALGKVIRNPRAMDILIALARDPAANVRGNARDILGKSGRSHPAALLALAAEEGNARDRLLQRWLSLRRDELQKQLAGRRPAPGLVAEFTKHTGSTDDSTLAVLTRLAQERDPALAKAAIEGLSLLADGRVEDALLTRVTVETRPEVRTAALFALVRRGDDRVFAPLRVWADEQAAAGRKHHDRKTPYSDAGHALPPRFLPHLVAQYRDATDAERRQRARWMIEGFLRIELLDDAAALAHVRKLATDQDEFLHASAHQVLEWEQKRRTRDAAPAVAYRSALMAGASVGILLGAVMFLLAFKLLMLKRFIRGLQVSRVRSAALGLVALQGEAQPVAGQLVTHPFTGELCIAHDGVRGSFWLDDGTGRILVEPRGAALLSEDGVLVPGERVLVVGTLRKAARGDVPEGEMRFITSGRAFSTLFGKLISAAVRAVTGLVLGRRTAPMMFVYPDDAFWIWDDLDQRPFASERETAVMVAGLLFAGAWTLVFVLAVLGLSSA